MIGIVSFNLDYSENFWMIFFITALFVGWIFITALLVGWTKRRFSCQDGTHKGFQELIESKQTDIVLIECSLRFLFSCYFCDDFSIGCSVVKKIP